MYFLIGLLTFVLILNCVLVILLVLVQLPKKDAGAGMAFGAGTADALFGSGSGNALTKITKWAAGIFLGLCFVVGYMESSHSSDSGAAFTQQVKAVGAQIQPPPTAPTSTQPAAAPASGSQPVQFSTPPPVSTVPASGK